MPELLEDKPMEEPRYCEQTTREARTSELWHRGCIIGLAATIILFLVFSLSGGPHVLQVVFAIAAFVMAIGYMATTLWVLSLRSERKRQSKTTAKTS